MWRRKRGRGQFRPHELAVLDAVVLALEPAAAALLEAQVDSVEMIQRHLDDAEVNLYPNRRGPQQHDPGLAFPNLDDDLRLATVDLAGPAGTGKARVYVVRGHLFQVAFKPPPRRLGDLRLVRAIDAVVHADPMISSLGAGVDGHLAELDPALRADLERMWAEGSGAPTELGAATDMYRIVLPDGEYIVLAQFADTTFLVAPIDPSRPGVRRFWPDGDLVADHPDLASAIEDAGSAAWTS